MINTTNITEEEGLDSYHKNIELFWSFVALSVLIALIAILGNGLVIYATHGTRNLGPLRYLDGVVKSLAFTDLFFGLFGTPLIIINYYLGKFPTY